LNKECVSIPLRRAYGSDISVSNNYFCKPYSRGKGPGVESLPDEFFEIRRIERVKTDL
jgi:hypothetical protein